MSKEITIDGIIYIPKEENTSSKKTTKKVWFQIKNRFTWDIIYESEKTTCRDAVIEYCNNNTDADFTDADFTGADLTGVNFTGVNFTGANLTGVNFTGANLTRVDLTGVDLTDANLTRVDLTGALFYFWHGFRNFEALCKAIKTIKHVDGKWEDFIK